MDEACVVCSWLTTGQLLGLDKLFTKITTEMGSRVERVFRVEGVKEFTWKCPCVIRTITLPVDVPDLFHLGILANVVVEAHKETANKPWRNILQEHIQTRHPNEKNITDVISYQTRDLGDQHNHRYVTTVSIRGAGKYIGPPRSQKKCAEAATACIAWNAESRK